MRISGSVGFLKFEFSGEHESFPPRENGSCFLLSASDVFARPPELALDPSDASSPQPSVGQ